MGASTQCCVSLCVIVRVCVCVQLPVPLSYLLPLVRCLNMLVYRSVLQDPALLLEVSQPQSAGAPGGSHGAGGEARADERAFQVDALRYFAHDWSAVDSLYTMMYCLLWHGA